MTNTRTTLRRSPAGSACAALACLAAAWLAVEVLAPGSAAAPAWGQNSSLLARPGAGPASPLMLRDVSMTYQMHPPMRELKVHDLVTIRVDEKAQAFAEGNLERRKIQNFDAVLQDWVILNGLKALKPAPQSDGDQRFRGQANALYRAEADLETREALKFDITAEVVDIRPNGLLVLEAHRTLQNNEEVWEYALTGICRPEDILDGNMVLSKHMADLRLWKRERGEVRDGYRRGWLLRWWDEWRWF